MRLIAGAVILLILYFVPTAVIRTLDKNTKLGLFENEVEGVATEFMRRSPKLSANFEEFRSCMKQKECDSAVIRAKRDRIIVLEWPPIFDRVSIKGDWWSITDLITEAKAGDKELFFLDLEQHGADKLRNRCTPNIAYRYDRDGNRTTYDTVGFNCQQPKPNR
jgi:hypothetical protein